MTGATLRRLLPGDAVPYRTIRLLALETEPDSFGSTHAVEAERPLQLFADRLATAAVFAAFVGNQVVGMGGFNRDAGPQEGHKGHVWGVFVHPDHRRRGIARALMDAILAHADKTVEMVTLSVSRGKPAIALYEALGFATYGILPRSLRRPDRDVDEVMMVRVPTTHPGTDSAAIP